MAEITLREVTPKNFEECIGLKVHDWQKYVAPNVKSLAASAVFPGLEPFAVYEAKTLGYESPITPMVGFAMLEFTNAIGFILRILIDKEYQQQGYGRATLLELIRRLRMNPNVEIIAISHHKNNEIAGKLFRSLGFVDWETDWAKEHESEVYLRLPD